MTVSKKFEELTKDLERKGKEFFYLVLAFQEQGRKSNEFK